MLNLCIALIMFGVALQIKKAEIDEIRKNPKSVIVGLSSQLLLLPFLSLALIWILQLPLSISLGMLLISACPGGNVSNFATSWARANTTLSITLTSIVTITATLVTPISFFLWTRLLPHDFSMSEMLSVNFWSMVETVVIILFLPLVAGLIMQKILPQFVNKIKGPLSTISVIILIIFLIFAVRNNLEYLWMTVGTLLWLVILHNGLGFVGGYFFSKLLGQSEANARAISLETGVQNAGLALVLIFNFFPHLGGMMIIVAYWGIWDIVSALGLAAYWRKNSIMVTKKISQIGDNR